MTKKTLLLFSSRYGQTEKITRFLAQQLQNAGFEVDLRSTDGPLPQVLFQYNAIVLASSVYRGRFSQALVQWAERQDHLPLAIPTYTVLVHLNAADKHPEARPAEKQMMDAFEKALGCKSVMRGHFAGALNYTRYNFIVRWMMKKISKRFGGPLDTSQDHELTDWGEVQKFADQILNSKPFRRSDSGLHVSLNNKLSLYI
jgi:menaquinone-dependent protoporphyrinogen oxidase